MPLIVNRKGLAEALGIALPTVSAYVARGMPAVSRGRTGVAWQFDTGACVAWLLEQERTRALGDVGSLDLEEARRRKMAAEAALAEYDLAAKRGDVVTIEAAVDAVAKDYTRVRTRILAIPSKLAPLLASVTTPEEARDILEGGINECLSELASSTDEDHDGAGSDPRARPRDPEDPSRDASPAAPAHGKRVGRPRAKAQSGSKRRAGPLEHVEG